MTKLKEVPNAPQLIREEIKKLKEENNMLCFSADRAEHVIEKIQENDARLELLRKSLMAY